MNPTDPSNVVNVSTTFGPLRVTAVDENNIVVDTVGEYALSINGVGISARFYMKRLTDDNVQYTFRQLIPGWYWERYTVSRPYPYKEVSASGNKKAKQAVAEALLKAFEQKNLVDGGKRVSRQLRIASLKRELKDLTAEMDKMIAELTKLSAEEQADS